MSIKPLPGDVITQVKSAVVITTLNGVAFGLIQNSLDAGASKITISVDYVRGNCTVEDDGEGIPPAEFQPDGGLGRPHYTSKYPYQAGLHGRHGTFLASLAALSLLSVSSHHRDFRSHNSVTIHNSKVVARNTPALQDQQILASASGTRVVVRDLFGSMPVRVKQRAIEAERLGSAKNLDQLLLPIVALLLSWPKAVSLSVREASNKAVTLNTSGIEQGHGNGIATRTASLITEASLSDKEDLGNWVPVGASAHDISVSGCVCLLPVATKRLQFIALGVQPVLNGYSSNVLYEEVNRVFASSGFGAIEELGPDDDEAPRKTSGFTQKELKVKKGIDRYPMFFLQISLGEKLADAEELLDEGRDRLAKVVDLLQVLAYEFLKKHHFRPRSLNAFNQLRPAAPEIAIRPREKGKGVTAPEGRARQTKRPRMVAETMGRTANTSRKGSVANAADGQSPSTFAVWSRVKSVDSDFRTPKSSSSSTVLHFDTRHTKSDGGEVDGRRAVPSSSDWNPLFAESGKILRRPFDDVEEPATAASPKPASGDPHTEIITTSQNGATDDTIVWTEPTTRIKTLADPRTGFVVKPNTGVTQAIKQTAPTRTTASKVQQKIPLRANLPRNAEGNFTRTEAPIPCVPHVSDSMGADACVSHDCRDIAGTLIDPAGGRTSKALEGRISKNALQGATIINQVDRKFILVKVFALSASSSDENPVSKPGITNQAGAGDDFMLVLIDQHAADERCRVESLMKEYFAQRDGRVYAATEPLETPLRFELSSQDGKLLDRFKGHFENWGISYDLRHSDGSKAVPSKAVPSERGSRSATTVVVRTLPPSIMERCRLEPKLLIDLLRREIWNLNENPGLSVARGFADADGEHDWVGRFHRCPQGILEMINSRACRSAIMFNDVLTVEECKDVVRRLAASTFPFQCAHGRPSMVPLLDIGKGGVFGSDDWTSRGSSAGVVGDLQSWAKGSRARTKTNGN